MYSLVNLASIFLMKLLIVYVQILTNNFTLFMKFYNVSLVSFHYLVFEK